MPPSVNRDLIEKLSERTKIFCQDIINIVHHVEDHCKIENFDMPHPQQETNDFDARLMYKMLDAAPVFVVELFDGVNDPLIMKATKTLEKMFGYFSGELIDQPISLLIPDDKKDIHKSHILNLLGNLSERQMGENTNVQPEGIDKRGNRFPIELSWAVEIIHKRKFLIATVMRQLRGSVDGR